MGYINIFDAQHLKFSSILTNSEMKELRNKNNKLINENYSHMQDKLYVINAGNVFYTLFKIMGIFIPKKTKEKI